MAHTVPCVAGQHPTPCWFTAKHCRVALTAHAMPLLPASHFPPNRVMPRSMPAAPFSTADWQLQLDSPVQHCWMVHTYLLLMVVVVLPLLLLWQLEQWARWRFHLQQRTQQPATAAAAAAAASPAARPAKGTPAASLGAAEPAVTAPGAAAACEPPPWQVGGSLEADGCSSEEQLCPPQAWVVHWDAWEAAGAAQPPWAWLLHAYLLSCAIWAGLSLLASRHSA